MHFKTSYPSIGTAQHLRGGYNEHKGDALSERFLDLASVGGHLIPAAAIGYGHITARSPQGAGDIDGNVAAAENHDLPAHIGSLLPFTEKLSTSVPCR
jgi:hypothetical protein